jgi:hypothetical protein
MKDRQFKDAPHIYKKYEKKYDGQNLSDGYKPDYVLVNENDYVILESERNTSRKAFVGGMIKAAMFLQDEKKAFLFMLFKKKRIQKQVK